MATIANPRLELLEHNHDRKAARVRVSYSALLNPVERSMTGLRFVEDIELWGADSPDSNDFLFQFPTTAFPVEADGAVSRNRTVTLDDEILDEDGFPRPTDEVFARIRITPTLPTEASARTNEIQHRF